MVILKSPREIELMRAAGRVVHKVHEGLRPLIGPGVATEVLSKAAEEMIVASGGEPLFKGVESPSARFPFPAVVCVSVNEEVVHGIPSERVLAAGDIVSIDCGVRMKGYCGDAARTFAVGRVNEKARLLLETTSEALALAEREMRPGRYWSEVAGLMQRFVESAGFSVVREFVGHGIGRAMHEEPKVPNYVQRHGRRDDFRLEPGLVLAVEPMVNAGGPEVRAGDSSGWPQVTRDGSWSAHFENTIAVTSSGIDVLTDGH